MHGRRSQTELLLWFGAELSSLLTKESVVVLAQGRTKASLDSSGSMAPGQHSCDSTAGATAPGA